MREAAGGKAYQLCLAACMRGSRRQGAGRPSRLPARSLCTRPESSRHRPWPSLCTLTVSGEEGAGTMAAERVSPSASPPRSQGPQPTRHPRPAPPPPPRSRREGGQRNASSARGRPVPGRPRPCLAHSPAIVISSTSTEPQRTLPRSSVSRPTWRSPANMSRRLPAMVISSTGWAIFPPATQNPAAPRE